MGGTECEPGAVIAQRDCRLLLTGDFAFRNKEAQILPGNSPLIIASKPRTLPTFQRDRGYDTALVGKWHVGLGPPGQPLDLNGEIAPAVLRNSALTLPSTWRRRPSTRSKTAGS